MMLVFSTITLPFSFFPLSTPLPPPSLPPPPPSLSQVKEGLEREVGTVKCCMEGRFKYVRTRETNLGNLVADIMRKHMKADVALLNSGTLRSDCLHEAGLYKMKVRGDREWKVLIGVPA